VVLSLYTFDSFFLPQILLKVVKVLTSLKHLTHLQITLLHSWPEVWIYYDIIAIATNLQQANSCFSIIEIWKRDWSRWIHTELVWDPALGMFRHVAESGSVQERYESEEESRRLPLPVEEQMQLIGLRLYWLWVSISYLCWLLFHRIMS